MKIKKFLKKCVRYSIENVQKVMYRIIFCITHKKITGVTVKSIEDTIHKIVRDQVSVSRFGDGEFKWILKVEHESFEKVSETLSARLTEVLVSDGSRHIVCVSPALQNLNYSNMRSKKYWQEFLGRYGYKIIRLIDKNREYYNANITRFYHNSIEKDKAQVRFELLKTVWKGRNVILVEGEYSRLGVGNTLLDHALSIRRIIAPAKNAFENYERILDCVKRNYQEGDLILAALGPTATVLAYDLSKLNMQTIDIGHIDIEYEWFLRGSKKKEAILGKAVNEAIEDQSNEELPMEVLTTYKSQIIAWTER